MSADGQTESSSGVAVKRLGVWQWLDLLPLAWLALVLYGYAVLALFPLTSTRDELPPTVPVDLPGGLYTEWPGLPRVEALILPVLAAMGLTAIIRYTCYRDSGPDPAANTAAPAVGAPRTFHES